MQWYIYAENAKIIYTVLGAKTLLLDIALTIVNRYAGT